MAVAAKVPARATIGEHDWSCLERAYNEGLGENKIVEIRGGDSRLKKELRKFRTAWNRLSQDTKFWLASDDEKDRIYRERAAKFDIEKRLDDAFMLLGTRSGARANYAHRRVAHHLKEIWTRQGFGDFAVPGRIVADKKPRAEDFDTTSSDRKPNDFVAQLADALQRFDSSLKTRHQAVQKAHTAAEASEKYSINFE